MDAIARLQKELQAATTGKVELVRAISDRYMTLIQSNLDRQSKTDTDTDSIVMVQNGEIVEVKPRAEDTGGRGPQELLNELRAFLELSVVKEVLAREQQESEIRRKQEKEEEVENGRQAEGDRDNIALHVERDLRDGITPSVSAARSNGAAAATTTAIRLRRAKHHPSPIIPGTGKPYCRGINDVYRAGDSGQSKLVRVAEQGSLRIGRVQIHAISKNKPLLLE